MGNALPTRMSAYSPMTPAMDGMSADERVR
jgi:hypothetical protein